MANRLITVQEAARDLHEVIHCAIADALAEGVPVEVVNSAVERFFASMGGFPPPPESPRTPQGGI